MPASTPLPTTTLGHSGDRNSRETSSETFPDILINCPDRRDPDGPFRSPFPAISNDSIDTSVSEAIEYPPSAWEPDADCALL